MEKTNLVSKYERVGYVRNVMKDTLADIIQSEGVDTTSILMELVTRLDSLGNSSYEYLNVFDNNYDTLSAIIPEETMGKTILNSRDYRVEDAFVDYDEYADVLISKSYEDWENDVLYEIHSILWDSIDTFGYNEILDIIEEHTEE